MSQDGAFPENISIFGGIALSGLIGQFTIHQKEVYLGETRLPIHSPYGPGEEVELAEFILNNNRHDGKYVLICWHHTHIADLILAFGYLPPAGIIPYPNRYDLAWIMIFPAPVPAVTLSPILQELMFDDSTTFP